MKETLENALFRLEEMRDDVLLNYLGALNNFTPDNGDMGAVNKAGILHDLDKHITNLHLELKRIESADMVNAFSTNWTGRVS